MEILFGRVHTTSANRCAVRNVGMANLTPGSGQNAISAKTGANHGRE